MRIDVTRAENFHRVTVGGSVVKRILGFRYDYLMYAVAVFCRFPGINEIVISVILKFKSAP